MTETQTNHLLHGSKRYTGFIVGVNINKVKPRFRPRGPLDMPTLKHLQITEPNCAECTQYPGSMPFVAERRELLLSIARENQTLLDDCQALYNGDPPSAWVVGLELSEPVDCWHAYATFSDKGVSVEIQPTFPAKLIEPTREEIAWVAATMKMEAVAVG